MNEQERLTFVKAIDNMRLDDEKTQLMDDIVLKLTLEGFCVSRVSDGWRRITRPEKFLEIQLETLTVQPGEDYVLCTVLNDKAPKPSFPPLDPYTDDYDNIWFSFDTQTVDKLVASMVRLYEEAQQPGFVLKNRPVD